MEEKGFLTLVKDYLLENNINFKEVPVNLKSLNKEFRQVINKIIFERNNEIDRIQQYAYFKFDAVTGNFYMEIKTDLDKKLVIKENEGYVRALNSIVMTQDEIIKELAKVDNIERENNKELFLKSISKVSNEKSKNMVEKIYDAVIEKEVKSYSNITNESFTKYCEYIKYLDSEYKSLTYNKIEEITYREPEKCVKGKNGGSYNTSAAKHDEISYLDRQDLLLNNNPFFILK